MRSIRPILRYSKRGRLNVRLTSSPPVRNLIWPATDDDNGRKNTSGRLRNSVASQRLKIHVTHRTTQVHTPKTRRLAYNRRRRIRIQTCAERFRVSRKSRSWKRTRGADRNWISGPCRRRHRRRFPLRFANDNRRVRCAGKIRPGSISGWRKALRYGHAKSDLRWTDWTILIYNGFQTSDDEATSIFAFRSGPP